MTKQRRTFSQEFKKEAVALVRRIKRVVMEAISEIEQDVNVIFPRDSGHGVKLFAQITSVSDETLHTLR